jgi:perosamine synthetase
MKIPFGKPMIGPEEKAAVLEVMEGPILVHGPKASQFEEAFATYTKAPHAVSVSSCTAGMHLIYFTLGLGPGDEVVVPAQTHVATAHAVELTGARAVFVDVDPETGNIDIDKIEAAISPATKAIAVVHYLGVPVDMPRVSALAKRHRLFLLEDCALAPGTWLDGIHAGLHGDAGVFSFYPVKHLTTAEGGMIILKDGELAGRLRHLKAFGVNRTHGERKIPGMYDAVALGFNYRMSEIHAAIGVEQMKKLPEFLAQRRENHECLEAGLGNVPGVTVLPQPVNERFCSSHYCLGMMLDEAIAAKRPALMEALGEKGVGTSIYYPQPVPRMSYYREKYGYENSQFVNAAAISDRIVALPVGPHLGLAEMDYITQSIKKVWSEINV